MSEILLQSGGNSVLKGFRGSVLVTYEKDSAADISLTAFLLTEQGLVTGDSGIVFYNQPQGPNGSAQYYEPKLIQNKISHQMDFDLSKVPSGISKIAVTLTKDSSGTFGTVKDIKAIVKIDDQQIILSPMQLSVEKGLIVMELYIKNAVPKVKSVWQGFANGLDALCANFGVELSEQATEPKTVQIPEKKIEQPPLIKKDEFVKIKGKVSLSKGEKPIIIEKTPVITASVSWKSGTDYDIYALVMTRNGKQVDVAMFGADGVKPLKNYDNGAVEHMGDVGRSNNDINEEVIKIRVKDDIIAIVPVVYSAQSNGTGSFYRYKVSMSLDNHNGTVVTVPAQNANNNDAIYTCVPGIILNTSDGIVIEAVELYSSPNSEMRPKLKLNPKGNVAVEMDKGPKNNYK